MLHRIITYEIGALAVDGWAVTFGTARRGLGGAAAPAQALPRCTKCNSLYPSTISVGLLITVLLYNGPLLCGFNVPIKG